MKLVILSLNCLKMNLFLTVSHLRNCCPNTKRSPEYLYVYLLGHSKNLSMHLPWDVLVSMDAILACTDSNSCFEVVSLILTGFWSLLLCLLSLHTLLV